jgi:hypothetical protein
MVDSNGIVNMVRCHACTQIEKEMLLVPKCDSLYAKRHKCEIASPNRLAWCNTTYLQNHYMQIVNIFFAIWE